MSTRRQESEAIRAALAPDSLAHLKGQCHTVSLRLVEASETVGSSLSAMWRRARVARGHHRDVPVGHSWVVVDEQRIVDVTLWHYNRTAEPIHRTTVSDPAYRENDR